MLGGDELLHQLVKIKDDPENGTYFLLEIVEKLSGRAAKLRRVDSPQKPTSKVPLSELQLFRSHDWSPEDAIRRVAVQILKSSASETNVPVFNCRTVFKPYQFRPLLKYMENPDRRILIADETGLGKTIEAAYILIEEMTRAPMKKVLVVCPSHLMRKWRGELWHRFGLSFKEVGGSRFTNFLTRRMGNLQCVIASVDCGRSIDGPGFERILREGELDLLIIDEVHHMIGRGGDTIRRKLGLALSAISKRVVGLSATPVHLDLMDLKRVLDIISPGFASEEEFEDEMEVNGLLSRLYRILSRGKCGDIEKKEASEVISELRNRLPPERISFEGTALESLLEELTSKSDTEMNDPKTRHALRLRVKAFNTLAKMFTRTRRAEVGENRKRIVLNEVVRFDSKVSKAVQDGKLVEVSEHSLFKEIDELLKESFSYVHRRQLASCLPAMLDLMRVGMKGFNVWTGEELEKVETTLDENKKEICRRLADKYSLLKKDTKLEKLKEVIEQLKKSARARKILVFTEWVPTIEYFRKKMHEIDAKCYVITGEDSEESRTRKMQAFQRYADFAVLFSADILSEGVDIQSADCLVNYDLPYNPQRVEQRIGRIDRIGQESDAIRIVNLMVEGSTDQSVYETLLKRIHVFERGIGELPDTLVQRVGESGTIDEDELIRHIQEYEMRREILEHDALLGLDDALDEEIKEAYAAKKGTTSDIRGLIFEKLISLISGEGGIECIFGDGGTLELHNVKDGDIEVLESLVSIGDRERVGGELRSALQEDDSMKISFDDGNDEGLFLQFFHPLIQKALEITYRHYHGENGSEEIPTEHMTFRGSIEGVPEGGYLALVECSFPGENGHKKEFNWWCCAQDDIEKKPDMRLQKLWKVHRRGDNLMKVPVGSELVPPAELTRMISLDFEEWSNRMRDRERATLLVRRKKEIDRIDFWLKKSGSYPRQYGTIDGNGEISAGANEYLINRKRNLLLEIGELEQEELGITKIPKGKYRVMLLVKVEGNGTSGG